MDLPAPVTMSSKLSAGFPQFLGLSALFSTVFSSSANVRGILDSSGIKWLVLGTTIESGRRLSKWFIERFKFFQYNITAQFDEGDPAYEWIVLFLTQNHVWKRSNEFRVSANNNSQRKWGIKPWSKETIHGHCDYIPTYSDPQLFRWKGYWIEIQRRPSYNPHQGRVGPGVSGGGGGVIILTIYTRSISVLSELVETARAKYLDVTRPMVTIHMADQNYGPGYLWNQVRHKTKRPLNSIILRDGVLTSVLRDAQEFIRSEDWYLQAGIPHRRGYLLHGPPGTGKTSTVYALAGELGLEIYSLSLSSHFIDDAYLSRAISAIPKHSILLIEDIDCAFPSREEIEAAGEEQWQAGAVVLGSHGGRRRKRSMVTLSGLLNVIDGVGSEEGRLFFATTNYLDRLDPALLRPGRIDRKIEYSYATPEQAAALFERFFPPERFPDLQVIAPLAVVEPNLFPPTPPMEPSEILPEIIGTVPPATGMGTTLEQLSARFSAEIPNEEFTTAELQGFLLSCKKDPLRAAETIGAWVAEERLDRKRREEEEEERRRKAREAKLKREGAMKDLYTRGPIMGASFGRSSIGVATEAI